jgi:selenocysteine-specific elongation factor
VRIVGTAGHVDHGKSALVISLTGHDPDRFIEERERGMTLDLGFAPLRFPDGTRAGVIDVPGHERFLHNMLAGAAGIDVLLLVIDAVEGPRRQTLEHLRILDLLNVRSAVIVLTKADLVDEARLSAAAALAREACLGTIAEGAPLVAISNVTGSGIDELMQVIREAVAGLPPHAADAPAYLPVDRVFALPGHGTIVTGTLMQGTIRRGDVLRLQPSGHVARIRGVQIFGETVAEATAGSRVALNIAGLEPDAISRGEVLAAPEFAPRSELRVDFTPVREALPLLKRRLPVRTHIGSAEIPGRLVFDTSVPIDVVPTRATVTLTRPTVFYPGSRLVLRRMSPKDLLGGAVVTVDDGLDGAVDLYGRPPRPSELDPIQSACLRTVEASRLTPLSIAAIAAGANITTSLAQTSVAALVAAGDVIALHKPEEYLSRRATDAAFELAAATMRDCQTRNPWKLGSAIEEIAAGVGVSKSLAERLSASWRDERRIARRAAMWHLPDFAPRLTPEQRAFFEKALAADPSSFVPASHEAVVKAADATQIVGLRDALESLVAAGGLVKIGDDLYRKSQIRRARSAVVEIMSRGPAGATMATLRDAFGTSRRYALPLLEYFDSVGLTVRIGDLRRLRMPAIVDEAVSEDRDGRP